MNRQLTEDETQKSIDMKKIILTCNEKSFRFIFERIVEYSNIRLY